MTNTHPLSIRPGETALIELPFSEVCMYMRCAGRKLNVELVERNGQYAAQIYDSYLNKMGAPVTLGEAGIHRVDCPVGTHFYHY